MAYQTYDILKAMEADSGHQLVSLEVNGGAAQNDFIMRFQAGLLAIPVERAGVAETTALGAAYLAGLACGFWSDREELAQLGDEPTVFEPAMAAERRERLLAGWHDAVRRTLS
jgi:glycerol kinase